MSFKDVYVEFMTEDMSEEEIDTKVRQALSEAGFKSVHIEIEDVEE